ncbi:MAG: hypothetical protein V8Q91_10020 [Bilophila wadsworthia]
MAAGTNQLTVTVRFDYCTCFALLYIVGESIYRRPSKTMGQPNCTGRGR